MIKLYAVASSALSNGKLIIVPGWALNYTPELAEEWALTEFTKAHPEPVYTEQSVKVMEIPLDDIVTKLYTKKTEQKLTIQVVNH